MADIFLSYSSQDRERLRPLVAVLERRWSVWWDRKIPVGKTYDQVIEQALDEARCVVVVWSQQSVQSEWVKVEADEGMNRKILVPVMIEEAKIPLAFRRIQSARLIGWAGEDPHHELEMLIEAVIAIVGEGKKADPIEPVKAIESPPTATPSLSQFEFTVATTGETGKIIHQEKKSAHGSIEDIDGVKLEMVEIPGGTFWMGSPDNETNRLDQEGPRHEVRIQPFSMGRVPVTQAQWRVVAQWPKEKVELNPDPSNFKGVNLPVEMVSWEEAVEFCARLSHKTGGNYCLPSESQWEYACRAGTTTPFHFGPTITPELANYDGNHPYGNASKGIYRKTTMEVGSFGFANAFGLFDMHGNVWEWCEDHWHNNYDGAPLDGSAWVANPTGSVRVYRGGGWGSYAVFCRSAYRSYDDPGGRGGILGFRLVRIGRSA